jgi:pyrroline-5-carboxylate reductase
VCADLAGRLDGALVLSIAAGIGVPALSRWLDGHERIVRIMPNTPAMIGKGVAGLYAPRGVDEQDRDAAQRIMAAAGSTVWLDEESGIDDITAISGSGPAYVFYFIEGLIDAARQMGFDDATARELALGTFEGAVALARHSGEDIATLRANVTSKGGTTDQAIASFDASELKSAILRGARACRARSVELGVQLSQD